MSRLSTLPPTSRDPTSQNNSQLLRRAHDRLDQMFAEMESREEYGTTGVELIFERGQCVRVRRTLNGCDQAAR